MSTDLNLPAQPPNRRAWVGASIGAWALSDDLRHAGGHLAVGRGVVPALAVAVVGVRATVEAVVVGTRPERVVAEAAVEEVVAPCGPDGCGAVEVDVVPEQEVVAAVADNPVVAGLGARARRGAVAEEEVVGATPVMASLPAPAAFPPLLWSPSAKKPPSAPRSRWSLPRSPLTVQSAVSKQPLLSPTMASSPEPPSIRSFPAPEVASGARESPVTLSSPGPASIRSLPPPEAVVTLDELSPVIRSSPLPPRIRSLPPPAPGPTAEILRALRAAAVDCRAGSLHSGPTCQVRFRRPEVARQP